MPTTKPKLGKLSTPLTATFPSEIASANTATPLSALTFPGRTDADFIGTPISPPSAYADFLSKALALNSPSAESSSESAASSPVTEDGSESPRENQSSPSSSVGSKPSPPLKPPSVCSKSCARSATMSASTTGPAMSFPSLRLPPSPAISSLDSPLSASTVRTPISSRSFTSSFDWDAALKGRHSDTKHRSATTTVRQLREVVTQTITYTPRMDPAPRGKRRRVE